MSGRVARWLVSLLPRAPRGKGPRLTIVRHHRVYADGERPLYRLGVSRRLLESQLGWLGSIGLTPVTVGRGLERLAEGREGHWVAMTFDDGYADNVTIALPLLEAAGARATFYLTAGLMEERRAAWWDEVVHALERASVPACDWRDPFGRTTRLELASPAGRSAALRALLPQLRLDPAARAATLARLREATGAAGAAPCALATWAQAARLGEAGMETGAHTLTHPHLSLLAPDAQRAEIAGSVALIERRLGARPAGFAYPGGDLDGTSVAIVREAGLEHAVTTRAGDVAPGDDRFTLCRRGLSEGACLGPGGRFSRRLAQAELDGAFDRVRHVEAA